MREGERKVEGERTSKEERTRDLARSGGSDLGFGGVYDAINDSGPVTCPWRISCGDAHR